MRFFAAGRRFSLHAKAKTQGIERGFALTKPGFIACFWRNCPVASLEVAVLKLAVATPDSSLLDKARVREICDILDIAEGTVT
jgi:hypothetical protein